MPHGTARAPAHFSGVGDPIMQAQFTLPRAAVRALLLLAASKDIRYYLNGILCEVSARRTLLCATNGHVLGVYRHDLAEGAENECGAPFSIIIPRDALEMIAPKSTADLYVRARDDGNYDVHDGSTARTFAAVEGKFPDWRRVMPRGPVIGAGADDLPFAQFDAAYLQAFAKAAKAFGCKHASAVVIGHRGQSAACVEISGHPEFFGVLMPLRTNRADVPRMAPAWTAEPMPAAPAAGAIVYDSAADAANTGMAQAAA
jgi:DNA polymerase-3 subunit beta